MIKFLKKILNIKNEEDLGPISANDWIAEYEENVDIQRRTGTDELIDDINSTAKKIINMSEKLSTEEFANKNIHQKIETIVVGNRQNYIKKLNKFMEHIILDPNNIEKGLMENFSHEFENFSEGTKKAYYILKDFYYNNLLEIIETLKLLEGKYKELNQAFGGESLDTFQKLKDEIDEYERKVIQKNRLIEDIKFANQDIANTKVKLEELNKKKESMKLSPEFESFKIMYDEKSKLHLKIKKHKDEFITKFSVMISPLKKYKRNTVKERLIDKYISDPFGSLKNDITLEIIGILNDLSKAIDKNEIEMNEKKTTKAKNVLSKLTTDYFKNTIFEYEELCKRVRLIDEKLNRNKVMMDIADVDYHIEHNEDKLKSYDSKLIDSNEKAELIDLEMIKENIETNLEEFAKRRVVLT